MGIFIATDVFQARLTGLFSHLLFVLVYIDDIAVITKGDLSDHFEKVEMKGVGGNEKVMAYYEENKRSVQRITRFDIFNLQYKLPAPLLRIPYDILNRMNRNKLNTANTGLVSEINHEDYLLVDNTDEALDLFLILEK